MLALRKEVKMGAAIGLTVLGIAGVYGLMASLSSGDHNQTASVSDEAAKRAKALEDANGGAVPPSDRVDPTAPVGGSTAPVTPPPSKPAVDPFLESYRTDGNKHTENILSALNTGRLSGDVKSTPSSTATRIDGPLVTPSPTPAAVQNPLVTPVNDATTLLNDPTPTTPAKAGGRAAHADAPAGKYVVESGDTFSTISFKVYGTKRFYAALAKANPDVNPSRLRIGHQINVPAKESLQSARGSIEADRPTLAKPIDASRQYRVVAGDTLSRIAAKLYNKPAMWEEIYDANKTTIGSDSSRLKIGMVLELPQKPAAEAMAR